jgi:ABC-2 type transport system ATP-binding protein
LRCQVTGSIEPFLAALAGTKIDRLSSREPSLEELFLRHYGDGESSHGTSDAA